MPVVLMQHPVFAGGTAFCFPEDMRKVRRGYKPHHLTNFRDAPVGVKKQLFRFAASDHMMIAQWCDIHIPPESTQQITAVYIKLTRHLVQ